MMNNMLKITIQLSALSGLVPLTGERSPPRHQLPALLGCPLAPPVGAVSAPTVVGVREVVPSSALTPGKTEWAGSVAAQSEGTMGSPLIRCGGNETTKYTLACG